MSEPVRPLRTVRNVPESVERVLLTGPGALAGRPFRRRGGLQLGASLGADHDRNRHPDARRRLVTLAILTAAGVALVAAGYLMSRGPTAAPTLLSTMLREREQLLIADFDNRTADSLLGPAVTEASDRLRGLTGGRRRVAARVMATLERMRRPRRRGSTRTWRERWRCGRGSRPWSRARWAHAGGQYLLSAQLVAGHRAVTCSPPSVRPRADSSQIVAAIDRLSGNLRARIGESLRTVRGEPPLDQVTTGSLEALWKYSEGLRAGDGAGIIARGGCLAGGGGRARHRLRHGLPDAGWDVQQPG